jgi:hypothetical protein
MVGTRLGCRAHICLGQAWVGPEAMWGHGSGGLSMTLDGLPAYSLGE